MKLKVQDLIVKAQKLLFIAKGWIILSAKNAYHAADWFLRKKSYREFKVIKAPSMPSLIGMFVIGQPVIGKESIFISLKGDNEYRTVKPLVIRKLDADDYQIFSSHMSVQVKRIK